MTFLGSTLPPRWWCRRRACVVDVCAGSGAGTTGTISAAVDQTGGVLPGATVVQASVTGRTHEAVANESGRYNLPLLQPGNYELTFNLTDSSRSSSKARPHVNDRPEVNGSSA
jgi:hypothetical protein